MCMNVCVCGGGNTHVGFLSVDQFENTFIFYFCTKLQIEAINLYSLNECTHVHALD